ncbi:hypothetical protein JUJ52_22905 [Virgibacillus sp. AGTR]|uniref:Uncharacterized protein n=1 Tax=Virgibacillus salarius TaxID=447199 RepID=A0A941IBX8_9BACI|nr:MULTISPECIES: hypothetical protein [Bacillaceae]NAZ09542.1 hypothetical protein [Agaribacter marinus]MBR7796832.1 hypothetical protein [Virgibacillus salarius]MCC2252773.1 hypothetical protein [Virgibacillus sp. AGTR]QRZ18995.1 hypothetical protein JUJ52_04525 [Virgibacillus sp. AGTR]WBX81382.1 hypothetical protein PD280_06605 [Virgibacillus salarius]
MIAFNSKDISSHEIATILDAHYQIALRACLQCSSLMHEMLQTSEQGAV